MLHRVRSQCCVQPQRPNSAPPTITCSPMGSSRPCSKRQAIRAEGSVVGFLQGLASTAAAALILAAPAVAFGPVSVKLDNIGVKRIDCGAGISTVGGVTFSGASQKAACLDVTALASNPSSKPLYNADVFGRVYDVNGEAAIDDTENIRIAYIDEIPPGSSQVAFKLFVPLEQYNLGPLQLAGFKASGFPGKNLPNTASGVIDAQQQADCEITGGCDDLAAEAAIR
eukprot:GHRR01012285.1.p1 GENE.GHRR01012285.1~~GHRR01012285.1.p1  ORF type:complete len:226 (+),score=78.70 GHRR01012285.1:89-766(+)